MHPSLYSTLADGHRRDLLAQAGHSRLVRAARSAGEPHTGRRRLRLLRVVFRIPRLARP